MNVRAYEWATGKFVQDMDYLTRIMYSPETENVSKKELEKHYDEKVSIKRVRELRIKIQNELRMFGANIADLNNFKEQNNLNLFG